jgi:Trypsin
VVLDAPARTKWPGITPAPLLPVGALGANQGALKDATFTLVGYGVDIEKKSQIVVPERSLTTSFLKNVQDEVVVFQINDRDSKAGGGSCFGDSGGPAFLNEFLVGDASYVNSLTCNASGGYQRVDTQYSRDFVEQFI